MSIKSRLLNGVTKIGGCWVWRLSNVKGYGRLRFNGGLALAHRVSYTVYVGKIPSGLFVLHSCDNVSCINPKHLFLGTQQDNMNDMVNKGRQNKLRGELHGRAKLTKKQVIKIRKTRGTLKQIAAAYSVSLGLISHIKNNRVWA